MTDCCHLSQAQGGLFPYIRSCKNTEGVSLVPCLTTFAKWELIPPICPVLAGIQVLRWSRGGCNHNRSVKETRNAIADQLPGGKGTHLFSLQAGEAKLPEDSTEDAAFFAVLLILE